MIRFTPALLCLFALLTTGVAHSLTYEAHAYDETRHAVWLPGLDQRSLVFDDGATFDVNEDHWTLSGALTSQSDGSHWLIDVEFSHILSGDDFSVLTGADDGRIKGTSWSNQRDDWMFARDLRGTITALDGVHAGRSFGLERMPGTGDYWAQYGTCLNDKNCDVGLSSWLVATDKQTEESFHGDINLRIGAPVPEPSAALVFGLGSVLVGSALRRSND